MADEVKLLTAEEIAEFRKDFKSGWLVWPNGKAYSEPARLIATLEALVALVAERDEAREERDTWKAEAEDQRVTVERLREHVEEQKRLWKTAHEGWGETLATSIARGNALEAAGLEVPE